MGLMDKFKNLFTDEEISEEEENDPIEIKEIKKEEVHQLPTFMREKIEQEKKEELKSNTDINGVKKDLKLESILEDKKEENTFKFPIDLEDADFVETRSRQTLHGSNRESVGTNNVLINNYEYEKKPKREVSKSPKVSELYKDKRKEEKTDKKFRATPIISPIYGVLDKNYTPNDMECSKGDNLETHRHSKNVDFDSVRKKAYGSLTQEIKENLMCENCEYLKEAKECQKAKEQEKCSKKDDFDVSSLVYEAMEARNYNKDITLNEACENYYDYGVEYEKNNVQEDDLKIVNHNDTEEEVHYKKEIPPVKSSINLLSTLKKSMGDVVENDEVIEEKSTKNLELTDDLFNLIDSMYDEREELK